MVAAWLGAAACALILSANVFRFPFLSDDFDFLGRAAALRLSDLLPADSIIFYRPLSREVNFWVITHLLGESPLAAHILNAAIAAGILGLLMALVGRLSNGRGGLMAGLVFACSAAIPLCVGWISAGQDLLCALFILIAVHLQIARKHVASTIAMAAAILSKETAVAIVPTVAGIVLFRAQSSRRERLRVLALNGCLVLGWAAVHPWTRSILLGTADTSRLDHLYIGFSGARAVPLVLQGIAMTLNYPLLLHAATWPNHLMVPAAAASGLAAVLVAVEPLTACSNSPSEEKGRNACFLVGISITLSSVAITSLMLGRWAPHYTLIPLLGLSMIAGPALARMPRAVSIGAILIYLWMGIGLRGNPLAPGAASEPNFGESAMAMNKVERGFKALHATLPASNVYVSVQVRASGGVYRDLFRSQPLRQWYHQQGIWVLDPNRRRPGDLPEFLFWIAPGLSVYEISLYDLSTHGPTDSFDLFQYQKTLRGYAYGLASTGSVDRATFILTHMPEASGEVRAFDTRSAAMLLYATGRQEQADSMAATAAAFPPALAVEAAVALLAEPVRGLDLDAPAMCAFGLDEADTLAVRSVMRRLDAGSYKLAAVRFAQRLLSILPGDLEATRVLERDRKDRDQQITIPVPYDIPQ